MKEVSTITLLTPINPYPLSKNLLLSLYLIIPILLFLFVIDALFLDGQIKNSAINQGSALFLAVFIPAIPHIVASIITLADGEYLKHYKTPIIKGVVIATVICFGVLHFFGAVAFFIVFAVVNMNHVITQQYGILRAVFGYRETKNYATKLKNHSVIAGILVFALIYYQQLQLAPSFITLIDWLLKISITMVVFYGYKALADEKKQNLSTAAFLYLLANIASTVFAYVFYLYGYFIFTILIPRLIHDFSAFIIYINHESNRNSAQNHNYLYKFLGFVKLPNFLIMVSISLLLAWILYNNRVVFGSVISMITFFHYYMEGVMWKRGALHRKSLGC